MSCAIGCRCGSTPVLLWLWCKPVAIALIQPPSMETSVCLGCGLKKTKKKKKNPKQVGTTLKQCITTPGLMENAYCIHRVVRRLRLL